MRAFRARSWLASLAGAAMGLLAIGIPTSIIGNPLFSRMTPVRPQDYAIWAASGLLIGLTAGTLALPFRSEAGRGGLLGGGILGYLAVGCPVCNKLVLLLLGTSGALTYFAPLQLYLGLASVGLLGWGLMLRARALVGACAGPSGRMPAGSNYAGSRPK